MSWLDSFFSKGYQVIQAAGVALPSESILNFVNASVVTDDPTTSSTNVNFTLLVAPTGTGVVHVVSGVIQNPAEPVSLSADVSGVLPHGNGGTGLSSIGTSGYVLTSTGSAIAWQAPDTGITTLTGDVQAGPGSGSVSATVVGLQGNTVSSGALVKGDFLMATSTTNWAARALTGDVSGSTSTAGLLTVIALQGNAVSNNNPSSANILMWSASAWTPIAVSGDVAINSFGATTVLAIQGIACSGSNPTGGQFFVANTAGTQWEPVSLSGDVSNSTTSGQVTVVGIQTHTVTAGALVKGNLLIATSTSNWASTAVTGDVTFSTSTPGAVTVQAFQGVAMSATSPTMGQLIGYNGTEWQPTNNLPETYNQAQAAILRWYQGTAYSVGTSPTSVCFDGFNIWVANNGGDSLSVVQASTGSVLATITHATPQGLCFDGTFIWVASSGSSGLTKINALTHAIIGTYLTGEDP